jgi:hypothetical protein
MLKFDFHALRKNKDMLMLNSYVSVERDVLKLDNVSFREDLLRSN